MDTFTGIPKKETNDLNKDPCGIEGKYEHWNREELENECNILVENIDALYKLFSKEKGELIDEFIKDINESIFEVLADKIRLRNKWQGRVK